MSLLVRLFLWFLGIVGVLAVVGVLFGEGRPPSAADVQRAHVDRFKREKAELMRTADSMMSAGMYQQVLDEYRKYTPAYDPDLRRLLRSAEQKLQQHTNSERERVLLAELRGLPESNNEARYKLYEELRRLAPTSTEYEKKLTHYRGLYNAEKREADASAARERQIKAQFSPWDGSHRALARLVKENLKDPDSYDHIETRYGVDGDTLNIRMRYRARNSFGGMVIGQVVAKTTVEGGPVTILSSE